MNVYYEKLYGYKFNNLDQMVKFLERHQRQQRSLKVK